MTLPDITNRKLYPDMARWFNPILLLRLLNNVIVSQMFGRYADRRLMIAALDTDNADKLFDRTQLELNGDIQPSGDGTVWFDFVADLGDGFDSTYAVAKLLSQERLAVGTLELPRGQLLIMGGDEVYPLASQKAYENQLKCPYSLACPDTPDKSGPGIPLFAIPGNHDWYDGLVMFLAFFCGVFPWRVGRWRAKQRRSYFALQLTRSWWIWCTDNQLSDTMDAPQYDYFRMIAARMPENSKVILCAAEPGWLYTHKNIKPYDVCEFAAGLATRFGKSLSVPIVLSGDTHHYSRYTADDGTLFVTSGGGGAFLHPTHQLAQNVTLPKWLKHDRKLELNAIYPDRSCSRRLLWRDLFFAFTNFDFALFLGLVYWLFALLMHARPQWDAYGATFLVFAVSLISYTAYQERTWRARVWLMNLLHAAAHTYAIYHLTSAFDAFNERHVPLSTEWYGVYEWLALTLLEIGLAGALIGGTIFGVYFALSCAFFDMSHNDAFSAMRIKRYKNFLRIRIKDDEVTIYPIGLTDIPRRNEWRPSADGTTFDPPEPLAPHLIEAPITSKAASRVGAAGSG